MYYFLNKYISKIIPSFLHSLTYSSMHQMYLSETDYMMLSVKVPEMNTCLAPKKFTVQWGKMI